MAAALMTLLLLATWGLLHRYRGLSQDGELYAFQAMARLNPALHSDVYLLANSQDDFTVFSPLYALFIRCLGLWNASVALFALCTMTFIAGAWTMARELWDEDRAWLTAGTCITIVCGYGAYGVFSYSENYLTARSMAEAMIIVALACQLRGLSRWSWIIAAASMFIHPLMALPGLLLLIALSIPLLYAALGAVAGVLSALVIACLALHAAHAPNLLTIVRGEWLEMIRERSQYLFLQLWRLQDWEAHARIILCLIIAALATEQPRARRLCIGGMLVGVSGLAVALIASNVGPVAILLQGQAWRWFWVTGFIGVLTLAPTLVRLWKDSGCGTVCATLLVASWTFPPVNGTFLAAAALGLWCLRWQVRPDSQKLLKALAYAIISTMAAWTIVNIWSLCTNPPVVAHGEPLLMERLRSIYSLQIPALAVLGFGLCLVRSELNSYASSAAVLLLITLSVWAYGPFDRQTAIDSNAGIAALPEWRAVIPPTGNVLVIPSGNSAGFIWFTLQRPSYLTVDQSAGIVFSREAAQEIRRRSEVLLPIMEPDWKIMTQRSRGEKEREKPHPITNQQLSSICGDPQLGFVIAKERLSFDSIPSKEPGPWKDWNLYDCTHVRQRANAG
jgi:hypothetical protein